MKEQDYYINDNFIEMTLLRQYGPVVSGCGYSARSYIPWFKMRWPRRWMPSEKWKERLRKGVFGFSVFFVVGFADK